MPKGVRKSKGPQIKQISKVCVKCNRNKPLTDYYVNSGNRNGLFKENFCKDCFNSFVVSKEALEEYCRLNNREFREDLWIWSCNKANEVLNINEEYLNMKDIQEKERIYFDTVRKCYAGQMNQVQYYHFIPFTEHEKLIKSVEKDMKTTKNSEPNEDEEKIYSSEWHGYFTQSDIDYLDDYFEKLQQDFNINNANYSDTARKVCKASLLVDKSFNDMLAGVSGADKRWKDAQSVFSTLSEAAKFSEKTRTENDNAGLGSVGEIVKRIEESGWFGKREVYDKDSIDVILSEFKHTIKAFKGAMDDGDTPEI